MTREVDILLFAAIIVFGCVSVPLIGLLIKHQQTMTRILSDNNRSDQVEDQLGSMRNEILQLAATVDALKSTLLTKESLRNDDELAARVGGRQK